MTRFVHERHKAPAALDRPRELVVACAPLRSNVNLSRIVRVASCSGVMRVIACGAAKVIDKIARDGADDDRDRSPPHAAAGAQGAARPRAFAWWAWSRRPARRTCTNTAFERRTALVVGNERLRAHRRLLALVDDVVEIPVYGTALQLQRGDGHDDGAV